MASCPDATALEELATGKLGADARSEILAHLDGCRDCAELVSALARLYGSADPALADTQLAQACGAIELSGDRLGRYRLLRRLGEGAMGVVFEAHDPELDRRIAVKLLHPHVDEDAGAMRARLLREARAMAKLAHPHVVAVFDVGRFGEQVFVAMELVEGTTLRHWLETRPARAAILDAFVQAGRGLEAAHAVGLVHRDFKPDNVLLGSDGRVRVTDFGLARPHERPATFDELVARRRNPAIERTAHTSAGAIVGTPAYMAPEQLRGEIATAQSDQFSFCVSLYEALFGSRPFGGDSFAALLQQVSAGRIPPPPRGTPRWLARLLARGLAARREHRYPSMRELVAELARDRTRSRRVLISIASMALGVVALVVLLQWITASVSPSPAASAAPTAVAACESEAQRIERVWNDARRAELVDKLPKAAPMRGKEVAARVTRVLDAWALRWRAERARACQADNLCLDERLRRFEGLVGEIAVADISSVERALGAADALPRPEECAQPARVKGAPAAGGDRAKIELVRGDIARAYALAATGSVAEARDTAARAAKASEELGYAPLSAEAQLAAGLIARRRGDVDQAFTLCNGAAETAKLARHDEVLTEAALALVDLSARRLRPADAERWMRVVKSDAERYGDRELEARLHMGVAALQQSVAEYEKAYKSLEQALALRRELHGAEDARVAETLLAVSALHLARDESEAAVDQARKALAISRTAAGRDDLRTAAAEAAVGRALVAHGQPQTALPHLERALRLRLLALPLGDDLESAESQEDLGRALEALGRLDEARREYERSAGRRRQRPELAHALARRAGLALRENKAADAVELHRQAVRHLESLYGEKDARLALALRGLGLAEAHAKQHARARASLERALALVEAQVGYGPLSGLVETDLGHAALAAGRRADALRHFDDAHVWISGGFGMSHPRTLDNVLIRADLAHQLGDRAYAGRLYGAVAERLAARLGRDHPDARRAAERATR